MDKIAEAIIVMSAYYAIGYFGYWFFRNIHEKLTYTIDMSASSFERSEWLCKNRAHPDFVLLTIHEIRSIMMKKIED